MCEAALLEGTLRGDAQDPRVAWLIAPTGVRRELQWPFGFSARFAPDLQIVVPDGQLVAREGDEVDLGGGFRPDTEVFAVCEINGVIYVGDRLADSADRRRRSHSERDMFRPTAEPPRSGLQSAFVP